MKVRIDKYLAEKYGSRNKAAAAIADGLVMVNGKIINASFEFDEEKDELMIMEAPMSFVSVGGFKLQKAKEDFDLDFHDKVFADIGASTGGFTDCLLQNGAKKVYCIDVGESQLSPQLDRSNLVVIDNYNARNLNRELFSERLDGIVIDVSFISLTYILSSVASVLEDGKIVVALIKPQFECESKNVGKNGIVKGEAAHKNILKKIYTFSLSCGLTPKKLTCAPIHKGKNIEYLILLCKNDSSVVEFSQLLKTIIL